MLKTKVKASRITNLTDARYYAAWEAAYIGFNLEEGTDGFIQPAQVAAMKEWLEGPQFIAELGAFPDTDFMIQLIDQIGLDGVQLGTYATTETIQAFYEHEIPVIKEIVWNEESNWDDITNAYKELNSYVECFLIDFSQNGQSFSNMENDLKRICSLHPTIVDADFKDHDINTFLEDFKPYGIAVKGGEEEKVGYKSFDEVDGIFEMLEMEEY